MIDPPKLLNVRIQAKAIRAAEEWLKQRFPELSQRPLNAEDSEAKDVLLDAYCNGFCQGFSDSREGKNEV